METSLVPPTVIPPALGPLGNSHAADDVEAQLYEAFMEVFEAMLRPALARVNTYGFPHRGDFAVIERFTKADGLAMERVNAEPFLAELFRAWRALNPRRGTHFLRYYLQLLYPGKWTITQLWQDPAKTYPDEAQDGESPGAFLTSRLRVSLSIDDPGSLNALVGSFRAVLPARFVLELIVSDGFASELGIASVAQIGMQQSFSGIAT